MNTYEDGYKDGYRDAFQSGVQAGVACEKGDPCRRHGINLGNYHSMLVEIVSMGMKGSDGSIEILTKGASGTDPLLVFQGKLAVKLQFVGLEKGEKLYVETEMKSHRLDGYSFRVCAFQKVRAQKGKYKLEREMLGGF